MTCDADESNQLNVVMLEGPQETMLWWQPDSHEDVWHLGIVTVGRMPQDFSIRFGGSRTFNKHGHIAIDDISFINCSLPGSSVQSVLSFQHFLEAKSPAFDFLHRASTCVF